MALQVITAAYCRLGGSFDLHDYATTITLERSADDLNVSVMGDRASDHLAGMLSGTLTVAGFNDYTDNLLDEVMNGYVEAGTNIAFLIKPVDDTVSAANPSYAGLVTPLGWSPITAGVGQVASFSISWPTSGPTTRATSA